MLPIYKAELAVNTNLFGGTTKPCLINVVDEFENDKGTFIVKIFKANHIANSQATFKEFICNYLGQEFGLSVFEPAIISVPKSVITEITSLGNHDETKHFPGNYFGSKYYPDGMNYSFDLPIDFFEPWQIENIFAFDVLIRNSDRRTGKPNLFIKGEDIFVYDHELCLAKNTSFLESLTDWRKNWNMFLNDYSKSQYVFKKLVHELNAEAAFTFDEFFENLKTFNLKDFADFVNFLQKNQINTGNFESIFDYLKEVKEHPQKFKNLLLNLIHE